MTASTAAPGWDYLDYLNVLEERLCAGVSAQSSSEQRTQFFLKAFQSELLERESDSSSGHSDDDDDDSIDEEDDENDDEMGDMSSAQGATQGGMEVDEVDAASTAPLPASLRHGGDDSGMVVESPRSPKGATGGLPASVDVTASTRTVTSDAESVHIQAEPARPVLIAVRKAGGYATQSYERSETLTTQQAPMQNVVRMRFHVHLQCRQSADSSYTYLVTVRLDNQHLANSADRGAVVKEFHVFAEKLEQDVKRNNRR